MKVPSSRYSIAAIYSYLFGGFVPIENGNIATLFMGHLKEQNYFLSHGSLYL